MKIGDRVRFARERAGLTQEELATKIGATQSYVTHIENNRRSPKIEKLRLIARALDVGLDFFTSEEVSILDQKDIDRLDQQIREKGKFLDYAVVIGEAMEADITPEEIREWIELIKKYKQPKTQSR